jgi:NAD(P)-dependent dehydrogenase (short-subunit alcohol dehydrogenase family)
MKVALVTGSASGIGASVASSLLGEGWEVVGFDLVESRTTISVIGDVTDHTALENAVARTETECGPIEAVVTCAGHYEMRSFMETSERDWLRMVRVHVGGLLNAAKAVLPLFESRQRGHIVAISSELGIAGGDGDAHYCAAKGAVIALVKSLAVEVAPKGILVNSVAPGPCDTPLLSVDSPWRRPEYLATLPLGRLVTPEEVAASVQFLIQYGSFFSGAVISPNAGAVI